MKKIILFALTGVACALMLTGCIAYAVSKAATVSIQVVDPTDTYSIKDEKVYMYSAELYNTYRTDSLWKHSLQVETTGGRFNYAEFRIKEIELAVTYEGAFVFVIFKGEKENGHVAVTVKENDNKSAVIKQWEK